MFDYVNNMQLALQDRARSAGLKAGAGVALAIGAGFLIGALWHLLAWGLDLGPALASLIVGVIFLAVGGVVYSMSGVKREIPSTDELKNEVEARLSLATEAALDRAKFKAEEVVDGVKHRAEEVLDSAQTRVQGIFGGVERSAKGLVADTERKVHGFEDRVASFATDTLSGAARKVGLTPSVIEEAQQTLHDATRSRAAPGVGLIGAFALGMTIASALAGRSEHDDDWDDDDLYAADGDYY